MTYTELQKKIARLEAELAEVKEKVKELKNSIADGGVFKPKDRERYWYISQAVETEKAWWDNYHVDHDRYAIGNCFPTEQSAKDTVRVLKLIQKARESQDGFVPDWENREQNKYALYSDMGGIYIMPYTFQILAPTFGFWEDESVCEQFIDENREELLWFFTEYQR